MCSRALHWIKQDKESELQLIRNLLQELDFTPVVFRIWSLDQQLQVSALPGSLLQMQMSRFHHTLIESEDWEVRLSKFVLISSPSASNVC